LKYGIKYPAVIISCMLIFSLIPGVHGKFGGYIYRFKVDPQYMNNEDIIVQVLAFRSSADNKILKEEIKLSFWLGREENGTVKEEDMKEVLNTTMMATAKLHKINLGRIGLGTWKVRCIFKFVDGTEKKLSHSFLVTHIPVEYSLVFLDNGRIIDFQSKVKNETFNIEVWVNYGRDTELVAAYNNITSKTIHIDPKNAVSVTVFVTDRYNWTNAMDLDHTYVYTVSKTDEYVRYVLVIIFWIVAIVIIYWVHRRW